MTEPLHFKVGETWTGPPAYVTAGPLWLPESGLFVLGTGPALTARETAGLTGEISMAVLGWRNLVGLAIKMEGWPGWQDTLVAHPPAGIPAWLAPSTPFTPESRLTVQLVVIAAGIVRSARWFSLSPHATRALRKEVADRWKPLDDAEWREQWDAYVAAHLGQSDCLRAAVARCKAGA